MRISDWSSDVCSSDLQSIVFQRFERVEGELARTTDIGFRYFADIGERPAGRPGDQPPAHDPPAVGVEQQRQPAVEQAGHRKVPEIRSEEHTSELQSLMRISYAVFCLTKKKIKKQNK